MDGTNIHPPSVISFVMDSLSSFSTTFLMIACLVVSFLLFLFFPVSTNRTSTPARDTSTQDMDLQRVRALQTANVLAQANKDREAHERAERERLMKKRLEGLGDGKIKKMVEALRWNEKKDGRPSGYRVPSVSERYAAMNQGG